MNVARWSVAVLMIMFGLLLISNSPTPVELAAGIASKFDTISMLVGLVFVGGGIATLIPPKTFG